MSSRSILDPTPASPLSAMQPDSQTKPARGAVSRDLSSPGFSGLDTSFSEIRKALDLAHAPPPPTPDQVVSGYEVSSRNNALNAELENELNIRRSMALVTGGPGVTGQPALQSAGRSLLGT